MSNMAGSTQPGANSRGRGGKFRKYTRGGGKHFSRDLRPLDADGNEISMWSADAQKKLRGNDEEDDEEDDDEDDEDDDDDDEGDNAAGPPVSRGAPVATLAPTREDRKNEKKARKEAAIARARGRTVQVGDMPSSDEDEDEDDSDGDTGLAANPNHSRASRNQTQAGAAGPAAFKSSGSRSGAAAAAAAAAASSSSATADATADAVKDLSIGGTPNRRERESLEALQAKERYRKLHEQGKTDEAKADLARLKLIREKREADAARKQAEKEEREALEKAKRSEFEAREAKRREAALGKPLKGKKK